MEGLARRISDFWSGLFDALVRDNKVLPPLLALLALLLFAWVAAGLFITDPDDEGSPGDAELVQSRDPAAAPAPDVEDRDADSYAAYRNKDPFRQLLAPAESNTEDPPTGTTPPDDGTSQQTPPSANSPAPDDTPQADPTNETNPGGGGGNSGADDGTGGGGGGQRSRNDSDGDGLTNRDEDRLAQDPRNPDTDGDGIEDGEDDADSDGVPDGQGGDGGAEGADPGTGAGGGGGAGDGTGGGASGDGTGGGGAGGGGAGGSDDELFDSGGPSRPR